MKRIFRFLIIFFILLNGACLITGHFISFTPAENIMISGANLMLFGSGVLILNMQRKALEAGNPHAFVRSVMGGILLKMILFLGMVTGYAVSFRGRLNKGLIICAILLYLTYLVTEVSYLLKLNKK